MSDSFFLWNGTSLAHMFVRLMTKTNHPYNNNSLTLEEFNKDYNLAKEYIKWHKKILNHFYFISLHNKI